MFELAHFMRKLAIVLDDIDVVGGRQQAGKGGGVRVPQGGRNDSYKLCQPGGRLTDEMEKRTSRGEEKKMTGIVVLGSCLERRAVQF